MKNQKSEVEEISTYISRDFTGMGITSLAGRNDFSDIEELKIYLTDKITELLDKNYEKLINTLYLIDVNEKKLAELFLSQDKKFIPSKIAELIIERQLQKYHLRQKYRRGEF